MPPPLAWLLCAVGVLGVAWALLTPAIGVPDEAVHAAYVQSLVERGERPSEATLPDGAPRPQLSTEQRAGLLAAGVEPEILDDLRRPSWSERARRRWETRQERLPASARADGGGGDRNSTVTENPPLYYLWEAIPYAVARDAGPLDQLYLMRLWSALMLLATTAAAWLLARELLPGDPLVALAAAGVAGLAPMVTFVSAAVNPDAMLVPAWTIVLWLCVRIVRRGLRRRRAAALALALVAALLVKPVSAALVPAVALTLGLTWWSRRREGLEGSRIAAAGGLSAVALALGGLAAAEGGIPLVSWAGQDAGSARGFVSHLWTFYGPGGLDGGFGLPALPPWTIWVKQGVGTFGWLEVELPHLIYALVAVAAVATLAAGLFALLRRRDEADRIVAAILAVAAASLLLGLHLTDYQLRAQDVFGTLQGRYLLPLLPAGAAVGALTLTLVAPRRRPLAVAGVLAAMYGLQIASLAATAGAFYA